MPRHVFLRIAMGAALLVLAMPALQWATSVTALGSPAGEHAHEHTTAGDRPTVQATVWTDEFEVFVEHPVAVAGEPVTFVVHVTDQQAFRPRSEGSVLFNLYCEGVVLATHEESEPARPGIYTPELTFTSPGEWTVTLVVPVAEEDYEVTLPPIKVSTTLDEAAHVTTAPDLEGVQFLKEQQWRVPVGSQPVAPRQMRSSEVLAVPETAVLHEDGTTAVFVQVAGEVFQRHQVELGVRAGGWVEVKFGLAEGDQVVTHGAGVILQALHAQMDEGALAVAEDSHDHEAETGGHGAQDHGPDVICFKDGEEDKYGITLGAAHRGSISETLTLTGEIQLNQDRLAQVVPRMPGIVREIRKKLGDNVEAGEILAVIESRALADAKADYLAAWDRQDLAEAVFTREEQLWQQEISSEQEYLDARQTLAETNVMLQAAQQKLLAMGLSKDYLRQLATAPDGELTRLEVTAPFVGVIIEKTITLGERVCDEEPVYIVADLSSVWLDLYVHERHLTELQPGQTITLSTREGVPEIQGTIEYIHPIVSEDTRTILARAELPNPGGKLRPGTFVTARVATDEMDSGVVVHRDAVQYLGDEPVIFIFAAGEYIMRHVTLGKYDDQWVEVVDGILAGENVVVQGGFRLKAEIEKRGAGDMGHGHAH
ncbi:MAG: efflux RND transporter periplasmic adaptor subunit [bacterium]